MLPREKGHNVTSPTLKTQTGGGETEEAARPATEGPESPAHRAAAT